MERAQAMLWAAGGAAVAIVIFAEWRERRRKARIALDAVGLVAWPTVQVLALIGLAAIALLLLHQ